MKKVSLAIYFIGRFLSYFKTKFFSNFSGTGIIPKDSFVAMQVDKFSGIEKNGEIPTLAASSTILLDLYLS